MAKIKSKKQVKGGRSNRAPSSTRSKKKVKKTAAASPTKQLRQKKSIKHIRLPISRNKFLKITIQTTKRSRKKLNKKQKRARLFTAIVIIISLIGTAYYSYKIYNGLNFSPPAPAMVQNIIPAIPPTSNIKTLPKSNASRIYAPAIDLDAPVIMVGREADGTLEVPNRFEVAGQYKLAPTPGEIGPAVIAGHVDSINGPAVFADLYKLKIDDKVIVKRRDGSTARFKVTKVQNYPQNEFPVEEVYGNTENAQLRLITCGGTFNLLSQRYSENTVVYAVLI